MPDQPHGETLRVWWIPQVCRWTPSWSTSTASRRRRTSPRCSRRYDLFQYEKRVKPDYSNSGGVEAWDEVEAEWYEYDFFDEDDDLDNHLTVKVQRWAS